MHALSVEDRLRFIRSLEIEPLPRPLSGDKGAAAIDSGSLVSFVAGVSDQHRSDALNCTLLAQLNSDRKFDRFDKTATLNDDVYGQLRQDIVAKLGDKAKTFIGDLDI